MAKPLELKLAVIAAIILVLVLLIKPIYRELIKKNKSALPAFIEKLIEARDNRQKPTTVVYKPEVTIKVLEGWTIDDVDNYLVSLEKWNRIDLDKIIGLPKIDYRQQDLVALPDLSEKFSFLKDKPVYYSLEGFLFPDTYRVYDDASAIDVVDKMLANFDKKLTTQMRTDIAAQGKTIYEIVIMASLIEKEAPINYSDPENKTARIVADIFWGRLKIGQALQSDATLTYFLGDNSPSHSGADLEIDSPYNTYKYRGLPPTPICNPGLRAIQAAIYPIKTDYNYFLTSRDGKNIYYAKTYEEHLNNKYKYLK
ncbi:MAG TPA: endolytic transglycosylase MltG [Candidatus Saccharimonadales bacterium]|nr:endolytic transglycosylase MltG [Candidatus Saccharimonadales bacterium]